MSTTRSTGTFTQIDRDCLVTLMDEGLGGDAATAFLALLTSRRAPHIGLVSGIGSAVPVMSEDRLNAALTELQMAGKIAHDARRDEVIIRSWFRRNTFGRPKLVSAATTIIDRVSSGGCLVLLASELLRADFQLVGADTRATHYDLYVRLWAAITKQRRMDSTDTLKLPSHEVLRGTGEGIDSAVWSQLRLIAPRQQVIDVFQPSGWAPIHESVRKQVEAVFT